MLRACFATGRNEDSYDASERHRRFETFDEKVLQTFKVVRFASSKSNSPPIHVNTAGVWEPLQTLETFETHSALRRTVQTTKALDSAGSFDTLDTM